MEDLKINEIVEMIKARYSEYAEDDDYDLTRIDMPNGVVTIDAYANKILAYAKEWFEEECEDGNFREYVKGLVDYDEEVGPYKMTLDESAGIRAYKAYLEVKNILGKTMTIADLTSYLDDDEFDLNGDYMFESDGTGGYMFHIDTEDIEAGVLAAWEYVDLEAAKKDISFETQIKITELNSFVG